MLLNISQRSAETLQEQIVAQVRARILSGELEADAPLPSIRELARTLRVAVNTIQRSYDLLLREGLVYARHGKGFFVAPLPEHDKSALARRRFADALGKLIDDARSEGLSPIELRRVFNEIDTGVEDGES